jgi:hypothetical protein
MLIAVDTDSSYAPCCYLICRVLNPDAGEGRYDWDTRDEGNTVLVQTDWDFPGLASSFGWKPCECGSTDGTVDCAHKTATEMITEAAEFLDNCVANGTVIPDPGYFLCD